jgi:hypothetical protein
MSKITEDKISVHEIKMFIGTGLEIYGHDEVSDIGECVVCNDGDLRYVERGDYHSSNCDFNLSDYPPIVRPISHISKEIDHEGMTFIPTEVLFSSQYNFGKEMRVIPQSMFRENPKNWPVWAVSAAASMHFDIFNWIGRGLAKEKED